MTVYLPDTVIHPYSRDAIKHMKSQESRFGRRFLLRSPQLDSRPYLVEWLRLAVERTRLSRSTVHLAVKLLDYFMDGHSIETRKLYFAAIGCLTVAAKFEEKDSRVPKLCRLISLVPRDKRITPGNSGHTAMEAMILGYFDWNVFFPTANSYVEILALHAVSSSDLQDGSLMGNGLDAVRELFMKYAAHFLDISLRDVNLVQKAAAHVAAAVVYSARFACNLSPVWNKTLQSLIGLSVPELSDSVSLLMRGSGGCVLDDLGRIASKRKCDADNEFEEEGGASRSRKKRANRTRSLSVAKDAGSALARSSNRGKRMMRWVDEEDAGSVSKSSNHPGSREAGSSNRVKKVRWADEEGSKGTAARKFRRPDQAKRVVCADEATIDGSANIQVTPDEGYVSMMSNERSFSSDGGSAEGRSSSACSQLKSLDLLLQASDTIEATETKHVHFKEEIIRGASKGETVSGRS